MKFTKMHGCGNDYVYVNLFQEQIEEPAKMAIKVSNRNFGVGGDGLITIGPSEQADFRMRIYNADGSEAEMCGNGIRCVAKYVYDHRMTEKTSISVETGAGIKYLELTVENEKVCSVRVDMGEPETVAAKIPVNFQKDEVINEPLEVLDKQWNITCISMGNPHAVVFVPTLEEFCLEEIGPLFENHPIFPQRTNTEFVEVIGKNEIKMRVWERGSGETLACGTGACASVMAAILNHYTEDAVKVQLLGGDLWIEYDRESNHIFMTGPATTVFEGELELE